VQPMLATPSADPGRLPVGRQWAYEVKWDGVRVLADAREGQLRLLTRNGRDATPAYPELDVLSALPDALLDGEVVAMDAEGRPSFPVLMERMHVRDRRRAAALSRRIPATLVVFDILRLYGVDLTARPFAERRATLERLELPAGRVMLSPVYDDGAALLTATKEQGLEGVVAKKWSSSYEPGRRSPSWVKAVHRLRRTCLVGGWRPQVDTSAVVGALLVGAPDGAGGLRYLGRVGSGIGPSAHRELARLLRPLSRSTSPFSAAVPSLDAAGARWCEPTLPVEVEHLGWTAGGRVRQSTYCGVRTDAEPELVGVEPR
jgi:bifunctional non-homologous end joining protein LigD